MKEFEVTVTLRNNLLKERRLALGMSQKQLAIGAGVDLNACGGLESMRLSPRNKKTKQWNKSALLLAEFHEVQPEELFPDSIDDIKITKATRRIDAADMIDLLIGENSKMLLAPMAPDETIENKERIMALPDRINEALKTITPREERVIRYRMGLGIEKSYTLEEIAAMEGVTRERIRQVEAKALRKLRHPSRKLKEFIKD